MLQPTAIAEEVRYSFAGMRQRHFGTLARTRLHFDPRAQEEAGLVVIQKDTAANVFTLARSRQGGALLRLSWFGDEGQREIVSTPLAAQAGGRPLELRVLAQDVCYALEYSLDGRTWRRAGPSVDGERPSPSVLEGFDCTGVFIGLYAWSNGGASGRFADFEGFEMTPATAPATRCGPVTRR